MHSKTPHLSFRQRCIGIVVGIDRCAFRGFPKVVDLKFPISKQMIDSNWTDTPKINFMLLHRFFPKPLIFFKHQEFDTSDVIFSYTQLTQQCCNIPLSVFDVKIWISVNYFKSKKTNFLNNLILSSLTFSLHINLCKFSHPGVKYKNTRLLVKMSC